jgi:hypothetical protein
MGKYEPLSKYLRGQSRQEVPMTFAEVERVLGARLPASAYKHRPWWGNEATGHVHARAWLSAGFQTERVDMARKKLVFVGKGDLAKETLGEKSLGFGRVAPMPNVKRHPLLGSMKGMIKPAPGFDFTEPADPEWGKNAYGKA